MSEPVREITNDTAPGSSYSSIDWAAEFKSPEFCAGLQTAVAEARANSSGLRSLASNVTTLEQIGEVSPSIPSTSTSHALSQDSFHWCAVNNWNVPDLLHYLDDYFTLGPPNSNICASRLKPVTGMLVTLAFHCLPTNAWALLPVWCFWVLI